MSGGTAAGASATAVVSSFVLYLMQRWRILTEPDGSLDVAVIGMVTLVVGAVAFFAAAYCMPHTPRPDLSAGSVARVPLDDLLREGGDHAR